MTPKFVNQLQAAIAAAEKQAGVAPGTATKLEVKPSTAQQVTGTDQKVDVAPPEASPRTITIDEGASGEPTRITLPAAAITPQSKPSEPAPEAPKPPVPPKPGAVEAAISAAEEFERHTCAYPSRSSRVAPG